MIKFSVIITCAAHIQCGVVDRTGMGFLMAYSVESCETMAKEIMAYDGFDPGEFVVKCVEKKL